MRVPKRIPPFTNPCKRIPPTIPIPPLKTASDAILVEGNCKFYDLKGKAESVEEILPPLIKNLIGRTISQDKINEMRKVYSTGKWSITALSNQFGINRSFVIRNVLSETDRTKAEDVICRRIDSLSLKQKRGFLMKYKIRENRRDFW